MPVGAAGRCGPGRSASGCGGGPRGRRRRRAGATTRRRRSRSAPASRPAVRSRRPPGRGRGPRRSMVTSAMSVGRRGGAGAGRGRPPSPQPGLRRDAPGTSSSSGSPSKARGTAREGARTRCRTSRGSSAPRSAEGRQTVPVRLSHRRPGCPGDGTEAGEPQTDTARPPSRWATDFDHTTGGRPAAHRAVWAQLRGTLPGSPHRGLGAVMAGAPRGRGPWARDTEHFRSAG